MFALLQPAAKMAQLQDENRLTELMVLQEDMKLAPLGDIWDEYLSRQGLTNDYYTVVEEYEKEVLSKR